MSRSGYVYEPDSNWEFIKWRGVVASSIRGKRGQALLREMAEALDAMTDKRLIKNDLVDSEGGVCAIGSIGAKRGIDLKTLDPEDPETIAATFDVATPLVQEIEYINDEEGYRLETPEERWQRVRNWVTRNIRENKS